MTQIDDVIKSRLKMNVHVHPDFIKTTHFNNSKNYREHTYNTSGRWLIASGLQNP